MVRLVIFEKRLKGRASPFCPSAFHPGMIPQQDAIIKLERKLSPDAELASALL
jgi:hypothetical protein